MSCGWYLQKPRNIPHKETINVCINLPHNNADVIEGINKSEFENLLSLAAQDSYFMFNDILYKQKDGVAIGSPLGSTMASIFLSFYELKWLEQCSSEFKPVLSQLNKSQNFMHNLMHVIIISPFHFNKKNMVSCHF